MSGVLEPDAISVPSTVPSPVRLPITTDEVFAGFAPGRTRQLEQQHGNAEVIHILETLGIVGPFRRVSPWELEDEAGLHLIHAGGYASLPFGEAPPALVAAAVRYLQTIDRQSFAQQTASDWRAALETNLVALLASVAPSHADSKVVFSNSGAEAVEVAIKLVRVSRPKAPWIITFRRGFHGKTLGALSLTANETFQRAFRPLLPGVKALPYGDAEALEREILDVGPDQVAGVVLEPVLGEGGVVAPPPDFLAEVERMRVRYGLLVVADEIQTGLGRSGHWFASVAGGLDPDIVTLAKPLSGGLVPIGATIARANLVKAMLPGFLATRHSSTFAGNSLAMAVGLHALQALVDGEYDRRARADGARGLERLRGIAERYPGLFSEVRGAGMLFALQVRHVLRPGMLAGRKQLARLFAAGLALRSFHLGGIHACISLTSQGTVRLTPALDMPRELQDEMWTRLEGIAEQHPQAWRMGASAGPARLLQLAAIAARGAPDEGES